MPNGIRVTASFDMPAGCPAAELSADTDARVTGASVSVSTANPGSATEFTIADDDGSHRPDLTPIFTIGTSTRYRTSHDSEVTCPCECLGTFDCAIERYRAQDGILEVVFYVVDYAELRELVATLRDEFPGMNLKQLVQSAENEAIQSQARDFVPIDRGALTERQREVLQTAYKMGYFENPREVNKTEIASQLNIATSTLTSHLIAAESKILTDLFEN